MFKQGSLEFTNHLLSFDNIDVNAKTSGESWTPFIRAVAYAHDDVAYALINSGKDIELDHQDFVGNAALMFFAVRQSPTLLENNITVLMIQKGANINLKNKEGRTALMLAVLHQKVEMVAHLISSDKIDLDAQDNYGYTALMYAIESGQDSTAATLISAGSNFELISISGATASTIAADFRRFAILNIMSSIKYKFAIEEGSRHYWKNMRENNNGVMPDAVRAVERWKS